MEKLNETEVVARLVELQLKPQKFSFAKFVSENYDLLEKNKREMNITFAEMAQIIGVPAGQLTSQMSRVRKKRSAFQSHESGKFDTDLESVKTEADTTTNVDGKREMPRKIVGKSAKYFNN